MQALFEGQGQLFDMLKRALDGKVDHLSLMNNSPISRHCFQLHLVEGGPQSQWRPTNWQQYDKHGPDFPRLHEGVFSY